MAGGRRRQVATNVRQRRTVAGSGRQPIGGDEGRREVMAGRWQPVLGDGKWRRMATRGGGQQRTAAGGDWWLTARGGRWLEATDGNSERPVGGRLVVRASNEKSLFLIFVPSIEK